MLRRLCLLALTLCLASPVARAADPPSLVFTAIPDQDESRLVERFTQVAGYLEKALGVKVVYIPVKSYPAAVTAFANDQVQLAWFGGFTGVQARQAVPGSQAIAQGAEDRAFKFLIIANTSTGLEPGETFPKGIAGKAFTFGSRSSTSGRLMPEYWIRKEFSEAPEKVFPTVGFSGDHSRTIQLVQSGAYLVGPVDYTVWELDSKAGKVDTAKVRPIWTSPPFPDYQWTIRGDVDQKFGAGFKDKVQKALLSLDDPTLLGFFGRSKFVPASNAEYAPVEEIAKAANLLQ